MTKADVKNTELKSETTETDVKDTETAETAEKTEETKSPKAFITETYEKAVDTVKTSTEKYKDMFEEKKNAYKEKYVQPVMDKGNDIRDKVKAEYDKALETGKKWIPESTIKNVEEKWDKGLSSIVEKVNLPTREDIDRLTKAMETLNSKMDTLNEKYSV